MKDPIKAIKTAYKNLLDNTVDFSGSPVPCFIGEGSITGNNSCMVITAVTAKGNKNKSIFSYEVSVTIDIISKQKVLLSDPFNPVDVIAEKAMELILPTLTTSGLTVDANFQLQTANFDSSNYQIVEDLQSGRLMKRQITFVHNIIEK